MFRPKEIGAAFVRKMPLWKRSIDIVGAVCGFILLSPLFLGLAILIKVVSPGPVFFVQQRIGSGGRPFGCFKFRTMKVDADAAIHKQYLEKLIGGSQDSDTPGPAMKKLSHDTRIIKYGNVVRATGLDELPQLVNVLLGHMSLVGPRPPIPYEVDRYRNWNNIRFDVTPGLTGLWQVSGKNRLGFNEMVRLDIQYAKNRSFLLDCKILLMTPFAVLAQLKDFRRERDNTKLKRQLADRRLP
jgi:lipopolysaccharide/colanic/teichoic acid biosynthesis glycosyltransferase